MNIAPLNPPVPLGQSHRGPDRLLLAEGPVGAAVTALAREPAPTSAAHSQTALARSAASTGSSSAGSHIWWGINE